MGKFEIVVPETTTNLVTNPSFEEGTTGWFSNGVGTTIAQSSEQQWSGIYSVKAITPGSSSGEGLRTDTGTSAIDISPSTDYSVSARVYPSESKTIRLRLTWYDSGGSSISTDDADVAMSRDKWNDISNSVTSPGTAEYVRIDVRTTTTEAITLYVDGIQLEQKAYTTTYCDGDQPDCEWNGAEHASTSTRQHWSTGGRVYNLADDYSFYIEQAIGGGMAPVGSRFQQLGGRDGALYRATRTPARSLALQGIIIGSTLADWHDKRQTVVNAFRPRQPRVNQLPVPRLLRYTGATTTKEIEVVYDSGLGINDQNGFTDRFALRLTAPDPYWYGLGERAAVLDTNDTLAVKYVAAREGGVWNAMGPPSSVSLADIAAMARGADGTIYVGGNFTNWDGIAAADYVAAWDGSAWSALATGPGAEVNALTIGADGTLYAGGGGAVDAWNGSSWSAVGALGDTVNSLAIGEDGILYAATDAGEVQQWDGSSWSAVGSIGVFTNAYAVDVAPDGTVYAAVDATVKAWDGSSWTTLGSAFGSNVLALATAPDGTLYAGGAFSSSYNYIAQWNGTAWTSLASGLDDTVRAMDVTDSGQLYVGGSFDNAGTLATPGGLAIWDGSGWTRPDITLPAFSAVYGVLTAGNDTYIIFSTTGNAVVAGQTTVSNTDDNSSTNTAPAYPVIEIERSGGTSATLKSVINETSGAQLWFDYDLLNGEALTIDLRPGQRRMVSSQFGERWKILPQSDVAAWQLAPGDNQIVIYVDTAGSPTVTATIRWRARYWSVD